MNTGQEKEEPTERNRNPQYSDIVGGDSEKRLRSIIAEKEEHQNQYKYPSPKE